jgi:hypothetical protein
MTEFASVCEENTILDALNRIQNLLQLVIVHQDAAVSLRSQELLGSAADAQGSASAFARQYIHELVSLIESLPPARDDATLSERHVRSSLIQRLSPKDYSTVGIAYLSACSLRAALDSPVKWSLVRENLPDEQDRPIQRD